MVAERSYTAIQVLVSPPLVSQSSGQVSAFSSSSQTPSPHTPPSPPSSQSSGQLSMVSSSSQTPSPQVPPVLSSQSSGQLLWSSSASQTPSPHTLSSFPLSPPSSSLQATTNPPKNSTIKRQNNLCITKPPFEHVETETCLTTCFAISV